MSGAKASTGASDAGAAAKCRTPSVCSSATTTSPTSACTTPRRAQWLDTVRQDCRAGDERRGVRPERGRMDALAADAGRAASRRLPLPRRGGRSRERRRQARGHRQSKGRRGHRPVQGDRALRRTPGSAFTATTRGARRSRAIPRPARRPTRSRRWFAPKGRGGRSDRRRSAPADQPHGVDAVAGVRAAVRRRRGHDRSQPAEPPLRGRVRQLLRAAAVADCSTATCPGRTRHFTDFDPVGNHIPGSVGTVVSGGATVDSLRNIFGSVRLRYFGPRALVEDDSVRSKATSLVNLEAGYRLARNLKIAVDVFNLLECPGQRHRLLLHVAAVRRAGRRRERHPSASGAAADRARESDRGILRSGRPFARSHACLRGDRIGMGEPRAASPPLQAADGRVS